MTAAQVPLRVEPAVPFAAPLLAVVPGAIVAFNRLQLEWGRRILGCHTGPHLRWMIVIAQCGWSRRLGSKLVERAVMARARMLVLPDSHPSARMLALADSVPAFSWSKSVLEIMASGSFGGVIPDLVLDSVFPSERVQFAKIDVSERRKLLKEYKWAVVRPILMRSDKEEYLSKAL